MPTEVGTTTRDGVRMNTGYLVGMVIYLLVKMLAYTAWSYWGICLFAPKTKHRFSLASIYGIIRLLMGVLLGIYLFQYTLAMNNAIDNSLLTYVSIYIPARICEWSCMVFIISRTPMQFKHVVLWVIGGILISCLADIPWGIMNGGQIVPHGRPFC
jgi:hypothetical protein